MWDSKITDRMDAVAREQILALRDDPRVIGYYSDNEMGWWNAILFKMTLEQAPSSGQRQPAYRLLLQTYRNDWSELLKDFEPAPGVTDWDALEQHGLLFFDRAGMAFAWSDGFLRCWLSAITPCPRHHPQVPTAGRWSLETVTSRSIIRKLLAHVRGMSTPSPAISTRIGTTAASHGFIWRRFTG